MMRQSNEQEISIQMLKDIIDERDTQIADLQAQVARQEALLKQLDDQSLLTDSASDLNVQTFIDHLLPAIALMTPEGVIVHVNYAARQLINPTTQILIGQSYLDVGWFADLPQARKQVEDALILAKQGKTQRFDTHLRRADDTVQPVDLTMHSVKDVAGRVIYLMACAQDMSKYAEMQQQLERVKMQHYNLLEPIEQGVCVVSTDMVIVYINGFLCTALGYEAADLIGKDMRQLIPSGYVDAMHETLLQRINRVGFEEDIPLIRRDGELFWVQTSVTWVPTEGPAEHEILILMGDVTERRANELELADKEALYRSVLMAMSEGVVLQDRDGVVHTFNDSALAILGLSAKQLTGRTAYDPNWHVVDEHHNPLSGESHPSMIALETGKRQSAIIGVHRPDDTLAWIQVYCIPLFDDDDLQKPRAVLTTFSDVTEKRTAEAQRFALALERERMTILSDFIRDASHEFRTPLANIQTSTYILGKKFLDDNADAQQYLKRIDEKVNNINDLIDHLVLTHRLDSSGEFKRMSSRVREIVENGLKVVDTMPQQLIMDVRVSDVIIKCHVEYMALALGHVLQNAVHFTPDDGTITLRVFKTHQNLTFEISDTGIGMTDEQQKHAFERFYRADDARSKRGFGLGLSIVERVVSMHGGEVKIISQPQQGTTVTMLLPIL